MTEQNLIEQIDQANQKIERLDAQHKVAMIPLRSEVSALMNEYSRLYSPLKPGTKIEYTPPGGKHVGIVKIVSATCTLVPDKWQYEALILSVGENAGEADKRYVGRDTLIHLHRNQSVKIVD